MPSTRRRSPATDPRHVQLAFFWVATSFVAAGILLAPMIARREPKHQGKLAFAQRAGASPPPPPATMTPRAA